MENIVIHQEQGRFIDPVFIGVATPEDETDIDKLRHRALYIEARSYARFRKDPRVLRIDNDPKGEVEVYIARLADGTPVATSRFGICWSEDQLFQQLCARYPGAQKPQYPTLASGRAAATVLDDGVIRPTRRRGAHRAMRDALLRFALLARLENGTRLLNQMGANAIGGQEGRELNPLPGYLRRLGYEVLETHCGHEHCGSFIYEGPQCTNRLRREEFAGVIQKMNQELRDGKTAPWVWVGPAPFTRFGYSPPGWVPEAGIDAIALLRRWV